MKVWTVRLASHNEPFYEVRHMDASTELTVEALVYAVTAQGRDVVVNLEERSESCTPVTVPTATRSTASSSHSCFHCARPQRG